MPSFRRDRVTTNTERLVVTGFIVSTEFCSQIAPITDLDFFETDWMQQVVSWCIDHYNTYHEAPVNDIREIYGAEHESLEVEDQELVLAFIRSLSEEYADNAESFNVDFYIAKARKYYKKRRLHLTWEALGDALDTGNIEEGESILTEHRDIAVQTSDWVGLDDPDMIERVFNYQENDFFKYPGHLGELIGPLRPGWLVAFMGPTKRGKTNWLIETAILCTMFKLRTVYFGHEQPTLQIFEKIYRRLCGMGYEQGMYQYPVFDCQLCQDGSCTSRAYQGGGPLYTGPEESQTINPDYAPCTSCRKNSNADLRRLYTPATWYTSIQKPALTEQIVRRKMRAFNKYYGRYFKAIHHPPYTATSKTIYNDLQTLEYLHGFVPQVIIEDYADIRGQEDSRVVGRDALDLIWKNMKREADERQVLWVTATQSNRGSAEKRYVKNTDISEEYRKAAHLDKLIAINQTDSEKRKGISRISKVLDRHMYYTQTDQVIVLQRVDHGQIMLDTQWGQLDVN